MYIISQYISYMKNIEFEVELNFLQTCYLGVITYVMDHFTPFKFY